MVMATDASALVLVAADDTLEAIAARVQASAAATVQLLVVDGTRALQPADAFTRLRGMLGERQIRLEVISSDMLVLAAARASGLETIGVAGTRVAPAPAQRSFVTHPIEQPATPVSSADAFLLEALEQLPREPDEAAFDAAAFDDTTFEPPVQRRARHAPVPDDDRDDDDWPTDTRPGRSPVRGRLERAVPAGRLARRPRYLQPPSSLDEDESLPRRATRRSR